MKFIYFTDIHLCQGIDSQLGVEQCFESMLSHDPEFLINGGDLGIEPEAIAFYNDLTRDLPIPLLMCNGNHEMCSGYLPREKAGTTHYSTDINDAHIVVLDVVRYNEPGDTWPRNWYGFADETLLTWLENDLANIDPSTPLIVAAHIPLSTTFPFRMGRAPEGKRPTNAVFNADQILNLLKPFKNVATLHGHDHENCRHCADHIQIMTTSAVSGNWWKQGLESYAPHGNEPQGYRIINIADSGSITSQYVAFQSEQDEPANFFLHEKTGRKFINVFDGSPKTRATVNNVGELSAIDPDANASIHLSTHFYELPTNFDRNTIETQITFENGQTFDLTFHP